jgi:hypothetical protein
MTHICKPIIVTFGWIGTWSHRRHLARQRHHVRRDVRPQGRDVPAVGRRAGVDFMKRFRTEFTDKTLKGFYLVTTYVVRVLPTY